MRDRILQVFYGNDRLPYKDNERTVHYPITGMTFLGSSNVDKIRFYVRDIGGTNNITWVLNAKLPNGSILYQVLSTIGLDSELNEYYVEFSVSQFYTQLKGDTYIALNGCDGDVTITTDDETNIQTITATIESQTILTTGVIKFSNNYAPQRPLGFSFDLDQYQEIINALSSKSNIANSIQVVANITSEDLSGYENGQLFYSLAQHLYYKKIASSPYYELADKGILASDKVLYRTVIDSSTTINDLNDLTDNYTRLLVVNYGSQDYLLGIIKTGEIYNVVIIMFNFGYNDPLLIFKGGTLDNTKTVVSFISNTYKVVYVKQTNSTNKVYATDNNGEQTTVDYGIAPIPFYIVQRTNGGQVSVPNTPIFDNNATSKKYVDDLVATMKANAFIVVDTEAYPTLDDFLDDYPAEEGYIYLYPSTIPEEGFLEYIYEGTQWLQIGTTQIDLSNYYTKTQTDALLNQKANDNAVVKLSGNQTIAGVKTFSSSPIVPNPTNNSDATNKYYVDTLASGKVDKTNSANKVYGTDSGGNQKTFDVDNTVGADGNIVRRASSTSQIMVPLTPIANGNASSKKYVDDSIASAISNVYKIKGSKTVAELNALTGQQVGDVYNLLDSGTLDDGNIQVFTGDNVVWLGSAWDKLGTEIDWSAYDEKFMSAGFFEVQDYNESTGEITMVYATELYDMTYNGDTGILSIEAN